MKQGEAATRQSKSKRESGQTLVLFVLMLAVLLGFVALAIDVGLAFEERRSAQNAVDAAALAAAQDLYNGLPPALATLTANDYLARHGYQEPGDDVTVNIPPKTGPHEGDPDFVEVIVSTEEPAVFRAPLNPAPWTIRGRAVATFSTSQGANAAILVLSETDCKSFDASGNESLIINNAGGIVANSNCDPSVYRNGTGTVSADGGIYYYKDGGYDEVGSGSFTPTPLPIRRRIDDPLASLTPPDLIALGKSPDSGGPANNPKTKKLTAGTHTLHPGVYYGGIEITSSPTVTLEPGIYVMAGGGFKIGGSASVSGIGITVYNTFDPQKPTGDGACAEIALAGTANFNLQAPTVDPYKNILFWQDRACTNEMSLEGNGDYLGGIIYAPTANVKLSGSAGLGSVQIIAYTFELSGNGTITVDFIPYLQIPLSPDLFLVE